MNMLADVPTDGGSADSTKLGIVKVPLRPSSTQVNNAASPLSCEKPPMSTYPGAVAPDHVSVSGRVRSIVPIVDLFVHTRESVMFKIAVNDPTSTPPVPVIV